MNRKKHFSRSPLLASLQRAFHLAVIAKKKRIPAKEIVELNSRNILTRRKFLQNLGRAGLVTSLAGTALLEEACKKPAVPFPANIENVQIAIVGGGIAGLNAAYQLKKAGYRASVYEAASRTGGRIYTAYNVMGPGLSTELGGEFIDSSHTDFLNLASEFGFSLIDYFDQSEASFIQDTYYFNGQHYSEADVVNAFMPVQSQIMTDINNLSNTIVYNSYSPQDYALDNISIAEYLNNIGATGMIKELINVAYLTEYGLDTGNQSAINLLFLINPLTTDNTFKIFGASDERYKVAGGNQQITDRLTTELAGQINIDHRLESIYDADKGRIKLNFIQSNGSAKTVTADRVILTLPFTLLREVEMQVNFPDYKLNAINNLGYGKNAKLMLGFNNRPWRDLNYTGYLFTDNGLQTGWDNSQLQGGDAGGYTIFSGGTIGENVGTGTEAEQAAIYLPKLNEIYPGCADNYNNKVVRFHWPTYEFTKGSYTCFKPGQWTSIAGAEFEHIGNIHFAGEHCSYDFQGYINGGASTGRKAAENIIASLGG